MGAKVNKREFADLIGRSPKTVSNMIDEGMPIAGGGGKGVAVEIDTEVAINWMVQREVAAHLGEDGTSEGSDKSEDNLLKRARREKLQLEIDAKRKTLVPLEDALAIMTRIAAVYATQLDALPARVAGPLALLDDPAEIQHKLFGETRRARAATADALIKQASGLAAQVDSWDTEDGGDGESAATEVGE